MDTTLSKVLYQTSYYDSYYDNWSEGPELIDERYRHACVTTEYHDGTAIVIAGGYGEYGIVVDSVEYLYTGDHRFHWRQGMVIINTFDFI